LWQRRSRLLSGSYSRFSRKLFERVGRSTPLNFSLQVWFVWRILGRVLRH
jgi:hypothetical protein